MSEITIPEEFTEYAAEHNLQPTRSGPRNHDWSAEDDARLLALWPVVHKRDLARALGVAYSTALARYRELTRNARKS